MTNPVTDLEIELDIEFRMIISHALLGCDTSDIDKETFDLLIDGCVKYTKKLLIEQKKMF